MLLIFDEAQTAFGRVGASCSASKLRVTPDIMTLSKIFGVGLAKAKRIRNVAIAHGIQIYVMAIGGSVLVDAKATSLAQTIPAGMLGLSGHTDSRRSSRQATT